jgi:MYXO-CTERM domain-containing protein
MTPLQRPPLHEVQPPLPERGTYGEPWLDNVHETEHFAVTWSDGGGTEAGARRSGEALEEAWVQLVDEQGWRPPVSSDDYLIWVILDTSLGGTGLTTEYTTTDFPQGYPVIYLNPDYSGNTVFWAHLSAHEFAHALQYAERDDYSGAGAEAWYWEASAEWQVEQALPDLDDYARQTEYYADQPWHRYDSMDGWHQYGMVALNAWLEEQWGPEGLRDVWADSGGGADWVELIEARSGMDEAGIWGGFTAAYAAEALRESARYSPVLVDGELTDGQVGAVARLGTDYFEATQETAVRATGEVVLSGPWGVGVVINVAPGELIGVTGLSEAPADYALGFEALLVPEDTGDSGLDTGPVGSEEPGPRACSCAAGSADPSGLAWLALLGLLALGRRR